MIMVLLAGPVSGASGGGGLKVKTSLNYDWIGQRYRLGESDTLDLYDEKSVSATLSYGDFLSRGVWAENRATFSDRSLRNTLAFGWRSAVSEAVRFSLENRLEYKEYRWSGEDLFGSGYVEENLEIEASWPLSPSLRMRVGEDLTYLDYRKRTFYFQDSWLSQTRAQLEWVPALMWSVDLEYSFGMKSVPDTSMLNYRTHSLSVSADAFIGWDMRFDFNGQLERRQMEEEHHRDYLNLVADLEAEYDVSTQTSLVIRTDIEQMVYDGRDEVYYDYWTATGKVGLCRDLSSDFDITMLPMFRRSRAIGTILGETYSEMGVEIEIDYLGSGGFWGQLSLEIGSRDYDESVDEDFYSGYYYVHPSLLANVRLSDQISLDIMADHEPEWHKQKEDNFSSSLFSCSVNFQFR
jgi:hypothetical protein